MDMPASVVGQAQMETARMVRTADRAVALAGFMPQPGRALVVKGPTVDWAMRCMRAAVAGDRLALEATLPVESWEGTGELAQPPQSLARRKPMPEEAGAAVSLLTHPEAEGQVAGAQGVGRGMERLRRIMEAVVGVVETPLLAARAIKAL